MKNKQMWIALVIIFMTAQPMYAAFGVDQSGATNSTAEIQSIVSLSIQPKNISDNQNASAVGFGTVDGSSNTVSAQYLEIAYGSNEASWGVNVWTDYGGSNPTNDNNMGGLHLNFSADTPKVSMSWQLFDDVTAHDTAGASITAAPAGFEDADWTFIKSRKDGDFSSQQNQYMRILVGLGTDETVVASGPGAGNIVSSPIVVYFAAFFGDENPQAGNYSATLGCDLYHE